MEHIFCHSLLNNNYKSLIGFYFSSIRLGKDEHFNDPLSWTNKTKYVNNLTI